MSTPEAVKAMADRLRAAGMVALPAAEDASKRPAVDWKRWQTEWPTDDEHATLFAVAGTGLGVVAGAVSGGLEMTELEGRTDVKAVTEMVREAGEGELWDRLVNGFSVASPSGGVHLIYRSDGSWTVPGNTKLAATAEHVTLAETRGEGGWFVTAPSYGRVHPTERPWQVIAGGPETIPSITVEERERFHALIRTLDQRPLTAPVVAPVFGQLSRASGSDGVAPGADFEARTTWEEVLTADGWRRAFARGEVTYWTRPGKAHGISATTGFGEGDWLYVFTSSTVLEPERTYTRFGYLAAWKHGGDHAAAARALRADGFGSPVTAAVPSAVREEAPPAATPCTLTEAHQVFRRWLGESYDLQALDIVLATAAVEQLDGDPVWLLMVSGSGNSKTETVGALAGAGAHVTSTIKSEGALLSATARKERATGATGGLLRKIGDRGLVVIKDFTSILSMGREVRGEVLAALREVYDGRWERNVGVDGGLSLTWTGRLVLLGAVTTAYDSAHAVIAAMGDRFALVRVDSAGAAGRLASGRQALANVGSEVQMRAALSAAVGGVLAQIQPNAAVLTGSDAEELLGLADLVTLARTAVERDGRGEVVDAHAPEAPTRFAKMLGQVVRGGLALGLGRTAALALARRVAADTMPPLRLALLAEVRTHPHSRTADVQKQVQKPRTTVDRALQELHVLGLLRQDQLGASSQWVYSLTDRVEPEALDLLTRNVSTQGVRDKKMAPTEAMTSRPVTDNSGDRALPFAPMASGSAATAPGPDGPCDVCGQAPDRFTGTGRCTRCAALALQPRACGHREGPRGLNGKCVLCIVDRSNRTARELGAGVDGGGAA